MAFTLSPEDQAEIRRVFLEELREDRRQLERLVRALADGDGTALSSLAELLHRIAGASHSAGVEVLGHLLGACEDLIKVSLSSKDPGVAKILPLTVERLLPAIDV